MASEMPVVACHRMSCPAEQRGHTLDKSVLVPRDVYHSSRKSEHQVPSWLCEGVRVISISHSPCPLVLVLVALLWQKQRLCTVIGCAAASQEKPLVVTRGVPYYSYQAVVQRSRISALLHDEWG
jgi:hypothetical protein